MIALLLLTSLALPAEPAAEPAAESLAWLEAAAPETRLVYGRLAADELFWSDAFIAALEDEARMLGETSRLECLEHTHSRHQVLHEVGAEALEVLELGGPDSLAHALRMGAVLREIRHLRHRAEVGCPVLERHSEWVPHLESGEVVVAVHAPRGPVWELGDWMDDLDLVEFLPL